MVVDGGGWSMIYLMSEGLIGWAFIKHYTDLIHCCCGCVNFGGLLVLACKRLESNPRDANFLLLSLVPCL